MRRPNHASRFEGIAKTNLQASRASDTETLQSQVNKAAEKRLSLSGLEILHGRLASKAGCERAGGLSPALLLPGGAGDQRPRGGQPLITRPLLVKAEIRPPSVAPVVAVIRPPVEARLRPQCVVAVVPIAYMAHALA